MKKAIITVFLLFTILNSFSQPIITTAGTVTSCPGIVTIPVTVANFNDVASISLNIIYDGSLMNYLGYTNLNPDLATTGTLLINGIPDKVIISWFSLSPLNIGSTKLLDLEFEYFMNDATICWDTANSGNCQYSNSNLDVIPANFIDGGVFSALTAPLLISPPNESNSVPVDTQFTWSASECSPTYRIQISKDSIFTDIVIAATGLTDTIYDVNNLEYNTKYFWRVNASISQQTSEWSDTGKFVTKGAPGIFEYNSNNNNLNLSVSPNPINGFTSICFELPEPGYITILIYNISGKIILAHEYRNKYHKGFHKIPLQLLSLPAGMFILEIKHSVSKKVSSQKIKIFNIK